MRVPASLKYSKEHEWIRVEGECAYIGITDYAQNALGEIVFVDMPEADADFAAGEAFGAVESVKAASDLYMPVGGRIVEVNEALNDEPGSLNADSYENWIVKIELTDAAELEELLGAGAYQKLVSK